MDVKSAPATRNVVEWDFAFLGGSGKAATIEPGKGDTVDRMPDEYIVSYRDDKGVVVEEVHVERRNLLFAAHRSRTLVVLDPKNNPVTQHVAELEARQTARHVTIPPAPGVTKE